MGAEFQRTMSPSCGSREPGIAVLVALCLLRSTSPAAGAHYIRGYEGDECLTPQRVRGVCLVIGKCPSLLNLVSQRPSQAVVHKFRMKLWQAS
ncbi:Protein of unknown function [Gryllus bimaculatus]|nr:Protein of unknown function [Gryllus bimaculatus]